MRTSRGAAALGATASTEFWETTVLMTDLRDCFQRRRRGRPPALSTSDAGVVPAVEEADGRRMKGGFVQADAQAVSKPVRVRQREIADFSGLLPCFSVRWNSILPI